MPGRTFTGPADYNTQMAAWLPRANSRLLRRTGQQPGIRIDADRAAMGVLPPVAPMTGLAVRVRLGRDYYVRAAGNDYSVDPTMIGRFVEVHVALMMITVTCAGATVAVHQRCWASRRTITDPAHVVTAKRLRESYQARTAAMGGPVAAAGAVVGLRALSDYDEIFSLTPPSGTVAGPPELQVVR